MNRIDYAIKVRPLEGSLSRCGDAGVLLEYGNRCFFALIDVLGHGCEAGSVAVQAQSYLKEHYREEPGNVMAGLHRCLTGTRGAVVSLCRLDLNAGTLEHVGIGNIAVRIVGNRPARFVSRDGIVGYGHLRPHRSQFRMVPGDVLMMYSDGVKDHFDVLEQKPLFSENAEAIADEILDRYGRGTDDASCMILKYLK